jgi:hypothetical protein
MAPCAYEGMVWIAPGEAHFFWGAGGGLLSDQTYALDEIAATNIVCPQRRHSLVGVRDSQSETAITLFPLLNLAGTGGPALPPRFVAPISTPPPLAITKVASMKHCSSFSAPLSRSSLATSVSARRKTSSRHQV